MNALEGLSRSIDSFYNSRIWNGIGALLVMYASKMLLDASLLGSGACWGIAAALGVCFYFKPQMTIILYSIAVFFSLMHISGFMVVVLTVITIILNTTAHPTAWAVMMLPLAFIPGSPLLSVGFAIFFFGICMFVKYEDAYKAVFYSLLWGSWSLFTCSDGMPNFLYGEGFSYRKAEGPAEDTAQ